MAIREQESRKRIKMDSEQLITFFHEIAGRHQTEQITFLCIGTDRSTGDALGPLTGSRLLMHGFPNVTGTLPLPCDADTLAAQLAAIPEGQIVIAIDACLGPPAALGCYFAASEPLRPAQSVGLSLPEVGNYSLAAIVGVNGPFPYRTLQTTPLYRVMQMAEQIALAAAKGFGLAP
ncbi:sporulation protein [Paenibacillus sp. FSL R7-0273]|uniref:spore protease YyaC n=1 Tax=Paenibacillus sp. FSL R7-0273 TaxID=1536772 RepID=UPI0004F8D9B6|nr:spore protease YyaC [Paenibacillus sp. FSL R7-0273]AIQ49380.1 sporulation protein [Paenibacillus sp. FSL R7-0273]OMF85312.1 spore protease YyaC [Paenibacillus sp. FSL R7-0273]